MLLGLGLLRLLGGGGGAENLGRVTSSFDDGLEAVPGVGGVLDDAHGAVGLEQRVFTANDVAVARLSVRLLVARLRVLHAKAELVVRFGLLEENRKRNRI